MNKVQMNREEMILFLKKHVNFKSWNGYFWFWVINQYHHLTIKGSKEKPTQDKLGFDAKGDRDVGYISIEQDYPDEFLFHKKELI